MKSKQARLQEMAFYLVSANLAKHKDGLKVLIDLFIWMQQHPDKIQSMIEVFDQAPLSHSQRDKVFGRLEEEEKSATRDAHELGKKVDFHTFYFAINSMRWLIENDQADQSIGEEFKQAYDDYNKSIGC